MSRGSLHKKSFKRIQLSGFRYRLPENGFAGPERFRAFRETGSCSDPEFQPQKNAEVPLPTRQPVFLSALFLAI